jgi:ABC-type sugar transport system substrate-binding protein
VLEGVEFYHDLRYLLFERLLELDMKLLDCSPLTGTDLPENMFQDVRLKLVDLNNRQPCPEYLLIMWPGGLVQNDENASILSSLRNLAQRGCRIVSLNELPTDVFRDLVFSDRPHVIDINPEYGIELLCGYIKQQMKGGRVLLIYPNPVSQFLGKRRRLYERYLVPHRIEFIETNTWQYEEARAKVLEKLDSPDAWNYDVIAAANDELALGAVSALDEYCGRNSVNLKSKVLETKVVGYDGVPSAIRMIKQEGSRFMATISASPRKVVDTIFEIIRKDRSTGGQPESNISIILDDLMTKESLRGPTRATK